MQLSTHLRRRILQAAHGLRTTSCRGAEGGRCGGGSEPVALMVGDRDRWSGDEEEEEVEQEMRGGLGMAMTGVGNVALLLGFSIFREETTGGVMLWIPEGKKNGHINRKAS